MKILVDHGAYLNLGDVAMLEAVVKGLHQILPTAHLHVVHREIPTRLFQESYVTAAPNYAVDAGAARLTSLLGESSQGAAVRVALAELALGKRAETTRLNVNGERIRAQEFCQAYDGLHIVGGGILNDIFPVELLKKSVLGMTFAAQRKPVVLTGQQLGPFNNVLFKRTCLHELRAARFVGVREPTTSLELCREAALEPTRFALMGDDSFGLCGAEGAARRLLADYGLEPKQFVAMNMRINRDYVPQFGKYVEFLAALADRLAEQLNLPILFVPIATDSKQGDGTAARQVVQCLRKARALVLDNADLSAASIKGVLGQARGAVGASFHFCTFALASGTPTVNVFDGRYYQQKGNGLTAFWNDRRLAIPLQHSKPDEAAQQILQVFEDEALQVQITRRAAQAVTDWQTIFQRETRAHFGSD